MNQLINKYDIGSFIEFSPNIEDRKIIPKILLIQDIQLRDILGNALYNDIINFTPIKILSYLSGITYDNPFIFNVGDKIIIDGVSIDAYQPNLNGTHVVLSGDTNNVGIDFPFGMSVYENMGYIVGYQSVVYSELFKHIIPYLCYESYLAYLPFSSTQTTDSGLRKKKTEDSESISPSEIAMISNEVRSIMTTYKERLISHLESSEYPLYVKQFITPAEFKRGNGLAIKPKPNNYKKTPYSVVHNIDTIY